MSYLFLFAGNSGEQDSPDILARSAHQYVEIDDQNIMINEKYLERFDESKSWLQILDDEGTCIYEYNVPEEVPREYTIFELTAYCMKSDELSGYTLFYSPVDEYENYGAIVGCDSDVIRKFSFTDEVTIANDWLFIAIIFLVTAIIVVVASSVFFSRKISRPVADIIENINEIAYGEYVEKNKKVIYLRMYS